ncbi:hypothetical protein [Spiroplasma endosymbiont of Amphibalanus improvisus]|uniref:hypothetical protein n=1 Tax=Spiroplasma endosymbiont of Amphibalanus improvisus TaxID=3066327 RepID=UPI00313BEB24
MQHNEVIDKILFKSMDNADFGIFKISSTNANVYLEIWYMLGQDKETILVCNKENIKDVKFDIRNRNMVIYEDENQLRKK